MFILINLLLMITFSSMSCILLDLGLTQLFIDKQMNRFCVIVMTMSEVIAVNRCASDNFCIFCGFLFISCQYSVVT